MISYSRKSWAWLCCSLPFLLILHPFPSVSQEKIHVTLPRYSGGGHAAKLRGGVGGLLEFMRGLLYPFPLPLTLHLPPPRIFFISC